MAGNGRTRVNKVWLLCPPLERSLRWTRQTPHLDATKVRSGKARDLTDALF